ncbi:MAG: TAXI family TRAP transporter solute-binding subunit [Pseudonocardia sp.]
MRRWTRTIAAIGLAVALAGVTACGGARGGDGADGGAYSGGRLSIATGNTTGVYYQLGGGYADLISHNIPGYTATAEATGASVENLQRVASGSSDIAFTLADSAADAVAGTGSFTEPQPIRALSRIYTNYTQVIARSDAGIATVADMAGKRVSTGSPNSGTEVIALRLLRAANLDPDTGVARQALSLPETVQGMKDGTIDAMFWSGGLPTGGVTDLTTSLGTGVTFVPLDGLLPAMQAQHGPVYQAASIPAATYGQPGEVATIGVPNLLVVNADMPDDLAASLTNLLFDKQADLEKVHPEAANMSRDTAPDTAPVPLHPGAQRALGGS